MNRSTLYRQHNSRRADSDKEVVERIRTIQVAKKFTYGVDRMTPELRSDGTIINHKRVARLMRENGLNAVIRKKRNYFCNVPKSERTGLPRNVLDRKFSSKIPGEKTVSDVTYLPLYDGSWCYVSFAKDLATAEITACITSKSQNLRLGLDTLEQLKGRVLENGIFHTDQGYFYTHPVFREKLNTMGLVQSLSRKGNCLDNAAIESLNGIMKCEWFYPKFGRGRWRLTFEEATEMVMEFVKFYNKERIQKRLGYLTPEQYRAKLLRELGNDCTV